MEESEYHKQTLLRDEWWLFVKAVGRHSHALVTVTSGLGILWIFDKIGWSVPAWTVPWVAAIAVVIGAFISWRQDLRAKEKAQADLKANLEAQAAIPDITGAWNRLDIGTIEITQDESGFHTKFDIGTFEHRGNPVFNAVSRRFEYVTTRYDSSNGTKRSYAEYLWVLDSDTLVFYAPKNAGDFPDSGVLNRAKI